MGCVFCAGCATTLCGADERPMLKVTVISADHLPRLDDEKPEIDAYAELRYGPATKMANGDDTDVTIGKTKIIKTKNLCATWNEVLYFPVPSLTAHYSLEISVWDKDFVGSDLGGTSMIQYSQRKNTQDAAVQDDENKIVLPKNWNEENEYTLRLESKSDGFQAGKIIIKCEFVNTKLGDETPLIDK